MLLLLLSVFLVPAVALLSQTTGPLATLFDLLDLDASGDITKLELLQFIHQFDVNHDGIVFKPEINLNIPIGIPITIGVIYTFFDIDSIPGITLEDINLIVQRFDLDLDGTITLAEQVVNIIRGR